MTQEPATSPTGVPQPTFEQVLALVADVDGWMTDDQGLRLWDAARALGPGARIVEIGSYRGRSAIVLAHAAPEDAEVIAIDPHAGNDRGPQQWVGTAEEGEGDNALFRANLERAAVSSRVRHVREFSQKALAEVTGEVDVLYIDGAHKLRPARADIDRWGDRVRPGGVMLIHDSFSSVGVTLALMQRLFLSRRWRYEGRSTSMTQYRRADLTAGEVAASFGRQVAQLPWFARNVIIKLAILARLWPLVRLLGHRGRHWPY
jgi:predicted O-methyltransferase YrrM